MIRVVASDIRALPIKRGLANDGATLMDFDLLHRLVDSQDPSGEFDVVDIATADAWSINGKCMNLASFSLGPDMPPDSRHFRDTGHSMRQEVFSVQTPQP